MKLNVVTTLDFILNVTQGEVLKGFQQGKDMIMLVF